MKGRGTKGEGLQLPLSFVPRPSSQISCKFNYLFTFNPHKQTFLERMDIKTEQKEGVLVFFLNGNLLGEHANAPVMEKLKASIDEGNKKVLFNLGELKFINSTGLGMLLTALSKTRNAGGEMTLTNVPDQMNKLLVMTKLKDVFNVHESEEAGIAFLQNA